MRFKNLFIVSIGFSLAGFSCTSKFSKNQTDVLVKPEAGSVFDLGGKINLQVAESAKFDSLIFYIDTIRLLKVTESKPIDIATDGLALGQRLITARIFRAGQSTDISTNILLKSRLEPQKLSYKLEQTFPHDINSYTEGLEFHKGYLYESAGEYGKSSLRKVVLNTGEILKSQSIRPEIFAEGITIIDDKILQLTYKEDIGIVYDLNTLKPVREFPWQNKREGWGLCFDGNKIYNSDGSNTIYFLNKDTFKQEGYIEVYDQNGPVEHLNELEYIDGKLYANVFMTDRIVVIDPLNGQVTAEIDLSQLYPASKRNPGADVLNGIAWDKQGRRLFVTGKHWDKLFQIKLLP